MITLWMVMFHHPSGVDWTLYDTREVAQEASKAYTYYHRGEYGYFCGLPRAINVKSEPDFPRHDLKE